MTEVPLRAFHNTPPDASILLVSPEGASSGLIPRPPVQPRSRWGPWCDFRDVAEMTDAPFYYGISRHRPRAAGRNVGRPFPFTLPGAKIVERVLAAGYTPVLDQVRA